MSTAISGFSSLLDAILAPTEVRENFVSLTRLVRHIISIVQETAKPDTVPSQQELDEYIALLGSVVRLLKSEPVPIPTIPSLPLDSHVSRFCGELAMLYGVIISSLRVRSMDSFKSVMRLYGQQFFAAYFSIADSSLHIPCGVFRVRLDADFYGRYCALPPFIVQLANAPTNVLRLVNDTIVTPIHISDYMCMRLAVKASKRAACLPNNYCQAIILYMGIFMHLTATDEIRRLIRADLKTYKNVDPASRIFDTYKTACLQSIVRAEELKTLVTLAETRYAHHTQNCLLDSFLLYKTKLFIEMRADAPQAICVQILRKLDSMSLTNGFDHLQGYSAAISSQTPSTSEREHYLTTKDIYSKAETLFSFQRTQWCTRKTVDFNVYYEDILTFLAELHMKRPGALRDIIPIFMGRLLSSQNLALPLAAALRKAFLPTDILNGSIEKVLAVLVGVAISDLTLVLFLLEVSRGSIATLQSTASSYIMQFFKGCDNVESYPAIYEQLRWLTTSYAQETQYLFGKRLTVDVESAAKLLTQAESQLLSSVLSSPQDASTQQQCTEFLSHHRSLANVIFCFAEIRPDLFGTFITNVLPILATSYADGLCRVLHASQALQTKQCTVALSAMRKSLAFASGALEATSFANIFIAAEFTSLLSGLVLNITDLFRSRDTNTNAEFLLVILFVVTADCRFLRALFENSKKFCVFAISALAKLSRVHFDAIFGDQQRCTEILQIAGTLHQNELETTHARLELAKTDVSRMEKGIRQSYDENQRHLLDAKYSESRELDRQLHDLRNNIFRYSIPRDTLLRTFESMYCDEVVSISIDSMWFSPSLREALNLSRLIPQDAFTSKATFVASLRERKADIVQAVKEKLSVFAESVSLIANDVVNLLTSNANVRSLPSAMQAVSRLLSLRMFSSDSIGILLSKLKREYGEEDAMYVHILSYFAENNK